MPYQLCMVLLSGSYIWLCDTQFSSNLFQELKYGESANFQTFHELTTLNIYECDLGQNLHILLSFLQNTPNLKKVILQNCEVLLILSFSLFCYSAFLIYHPRVILCDAPIDFRSFEKEEKNTQGKQEPDSFQAQKSDNFQVWDLEDNEDDIWRWRYQRPYWTFVAQLEKTWGPYYHNHQDLSPLHTVLSYAWLLCHFVLWCEYFYQQQLNPYIWLTPGWCD